MATNIMNQTAPACTGDELLNTETKVIAFTPDQRKILGQVYRLILSWSRDDMQTDTAAAIRKES